MLNIHKLSVSFQGDYLFENISFRLRGGDRVGLIGKNGAGKSTLLKLLSGELEYTEGQVAQEKKDLKIGFLKQDIDFATYEWTDKTNDPTPEAKSELLEKLERLIDCEFEVVDQRAGIRPTVVDRRPLVGQHPNHKNMYVLNGLGTRGVLVAPSMAEALYNSIEKSTSLSEEIDINRFE